MLPFVHRDDDRVIQQLRPEIRQIGKRLMHFHLIEHAKKWYDYHDDLVQEILGDPAYAS